MGNQGATMNAAAREGDSQKGKTRNTCRAPLR
jgi:hypothetical protein